MVLGKTQHVQIRVSPQQKAALKRAAQQAGMDMSEWILARTLPTAAQQFTHCVAELARAQGDPTKRRLALVALHDYFAQRGTRDLQVALLAMPTLPGDPLSANYLAAMIEFTCHRHGIRPPTWLRQVQPLQDPYFATELVSLRAYLLRVSPPPFKQRNLFIDTTIGGRI
jgi:hypothetical protein